MLLTESQSAKAVGWALVVVGGGATVSPAKTSALLRGTREAGAERYLSRTVGVNSITLGMMLLTAPAKDRRRALRIAVGAAGGIVGITAFAMAKGDIPREYAARMLMSGGLLAALAGMPLVG
jgi:hypothetical protein